MAKHYIYTVFVRHSIYWKSFRTLKQAKEEKKELIRLQGDSTGIRINKTRND